MNRFEKVKMYKIVNDVTPMIYIQSTCEKLNKRVRKHKIKYKNQQILSIHLLIITK